MKRTLVLVRHGQSTWNLENRFTGWIDVPLSERGIQEAHDAGALLYEADYAFDVALTSCLERATHTLELVLEEMDCGALPIIQDWRLNERHYGALQGLNKRETVLRNTVRNKCSSGAAGFPCVRPSLLMIIPPIPGTILATVGYQISPAPNHWPTR